ncbi:MAG TPA: glycosyltransferase [Candidatus Dormibacteraeota bacterium]|nr:glycosyltransferase [Candidatus Dormibacteraeota bacterium]
MTRIAMISVHACPLARLGGRDSGGMNVYVRELARELGRRGVEVDVFTRWRERDDPQIQSLGPNARVVHLVSGPIGYYPKMDVYSRLPEFTERVLSLTEAEGRRYDLVHSHYWLSAEVAEVLRARWTVPMVQMFHTLGLVKAQAMDDSVNGEGLVRELAERTAITNADRIIAASELELSDLVTLYAADPAKLRVVPLGVDTRLFRPLRQADARAALGRDACEFMILFVGRIEQIKGIDVLLEAVGDLLRGRRDLQRRTCLVVVGGAIDPHADGSESEKIDELRGMVEAHAIADNVDFVGSLDQQELALYYAAADVCAVPSLTESFGLVALEAMACGTPVVATRVGGLQTVVTSDSGILVPPGDVESLADAIGSLLDDMELRLQLSAGARARAQLFTWDRVADGIEDIYGELLPARAGVPK